MTKSLKVLALLALLPVPAMAQEWSVEIYGGQAQSRSEHLAVGGDESPAQKVAILVARGLTVAQASRLAFGDAYAVDSGQAFGLGIYADGLAGPFQIGIDLMRTTADYSEAPVTGSSVKSLSAMLVGRYAMPLGDAASAYVGLGLGMIKVDSEIGGVISGLSGSDTVAGGQISLGMRHSLGKAGYVFGEVKRQMAFGGTVDIDSSLFAFDLKTQQSYRSTTIVIGYGIKF